MAEAKTDVALDASAANSALMQMLVSRMDAMQTDLKTTLANIASSTKTGAVSQDSMHGAIVTSTENKQDIGADESQSAGLAGDSGNHRSYDNAVAYQAFRFADRDRVHFDNMQALVQVSFGNMVFNNNLCQSLATVAAHKATLDAGKFED